MDKVFFLFREHLNSAETLGDILSLLTSFSILSSGKEPVGVELFFKSIRVDNKKLFIELRPEIRDVVSLIQFDRGRTE